MTQNTGDAAYLGEDAQATLTGVTALTGTFYISETLSGFYAADLPLALNGGVMVTMLTAGAASVVAGDVLDIVGTVTEFGSQDAPGTETQFQSTSVTVVQAGTAPDPIVLTNLDALASESAGEPYEGVLVSIANVQVINPSIGFGQWSISDGANTIVVDNDFTSYPAIAGEVLGNLTGLVRYSTFAPGQFILVPRSSADIVSESRPSTSIPQLLNPTVDGYVAPCPDGQFTGCGDAVLANMVVITAPYFITESDTNGPLYGVIIADPTEVDADGRLKAYSGIEITLSPDHARFPPVFNGYDFTQDADRNFTGTVPAPGDVVTVQGQNFRFYGMPQLGFVSTLTKVGTTDTIDTITMPMPAQFDGAAAVDAPNSPARLKGGRPADSIPPSAEVESYLGVWVELINVNTTTDCYGSPYTPSGGSEYDRDFGYFLVTGDVEIGDRFRAGFAGRFPQGTDDAAQSCEDTRCGDNRSTDNVFTSISGVVDINFDVFRVHPRTIADVQGVTLSTEVCE